MKLSKVLLIATLLLPAVLVLPNAALAQRPTYWTRVGGTIHPDKVSGGYTLAIWDSDYTHVLGIYSANLTASRSLTFDVNGANRSLQFTADAVIGGTSSGTNTGDQTIVMSGHVTGTGTGAITTTIANDAVSYAKMQNVSATNRILGRITGGAGDTEELTGTQVTTLLDVFVGDSGSGGTNGLVPAPATGDAAANKYLKANGTWATVAGGSGDITAVGSMTSGDAFVDSTADDDWLGLGASAGRIAFDDQTIDRVQILDADLDLGATGVRISNDGDGAFTWKSISAGNQEDLTWNLDDTANTIKVSSSTGATLILLDKMNLEVGNVTAGGLSVGLFTATSSINLSTTGVSLSGAAGVFSIHSISGGANEEEININLETVANTVGVSSPTGVTVFNFSSIGLQESGNAVPNATDHLGFFAATTSAQLRTVTSDENGIGVALYDSATSPTFTTSINIGSAGVQLSDDGDGALTLLGKGDGSDEDLTLNLDDNSNILDWSSSTTANLSRWNLIGLQSTRLNQTLSSSGGMHISAYTTDAQAADRGAAFGLGGMTDDAAATQRFFGVIHAAKSNSTNNNSSGYLDFYTALSGTGIVKQLRIDENGTANYTGQYYSGTNTLSDVATVAVDWNNSNVQEVTLGGNRTFTFSNGKNGSRYVLKVKQDGTGSRTATWPASVKWPSGVTPTLTATINKTDIFTFIYDGTDYFGGYSLNY